MQQIQTNKPNLNLLIFLLFLIYLAFPTQNSTIDAYNYAANVKWNHDIFFPHHLLYNFLPFCFNKLIATIGFQIDILVFMKFINAAFAALSLLVFSKIVFNYQENKEYVLPMVLFAGSCFGFMRYATENETYIIPIFWSLLSTYFFLKFLTSNLKTDVLISGIFAAIACLFHQIHILWYAGLLIGILYYKKDYKNAILLMIPAVIIPIVYYIAFRQPHYEYKPAQNLWQFVFFDYYYGTAQIHFGIDNLILGLISFIRSFFQVHGNIVVLMKKNVIFGIVVLGIQFFVYQTIKYLFATKFKKNKLSAFTKTMVIIFSLHLAFAIFSTGNAEFMVMLPMLLLLIFNELFTIKPIAYYYSAFLLLIWNMTFAIIPNHIYNFQHQEKIIQLIENKKDAVFVLSEDVLIQNMIYYKTGNRWNTNIYKSPVSLKQQNKSTDILKAKIDTCLTNHIEILTDCIDEPKVMSRNHYFSNNANSIFFKNYEIVKVDSFECMIGTKYISLIKK